MADMRDDQSNGMERRTFLGVLLGGFAWFVVPKSQKPTFEAPATAKPPNTGRKGIVARNLDLGKITTYSYDTDGYRVVTLPYDQVGRRTTFSYDPHWRLTSVNENGRITTFKYDHIGRVM